MVALYSYTTLNDPLGTYGTVSFGINDSGEIVGNYVDSNGVLHGSLYSNGTYTSVTDPSARTTPGFQTFGTYAHSINDSGQIVGYYVDATTNGVRGFLYSGGTNGTYTTLDDPLADGGNTVPRGINDLGQIVGYYYSGGGWKGFLYSGGTNGTYTTLPDDPSAAGGPGVAPLAINDSGEIVGYYNDSNGNSQAFLYSNGIYTTLVPPGASGIDVDGDGIVASGINDAGQVVGWYFDSSGIEHGFLYSGGTNGTYTTLDDPSTTPGTTLVGPHLIAGTAAGGINDLGQIVGYYHDLSGIRGFLATPAATTGLLGYWLFDGTGTDASGNGNNLALYGGADFAAGQFGQALSLDGTQGTYAQQPTDNTAFDFIASDFTIQVWVKTAAFTNGQGEAILAEKFSGASGPGWTLYAASQDILFYADGQAILNGGLTGTILTDSWNEVVVERSGGNFHLYFDGNDIADATYSAQFQGSANPLLIGARDAEDGRNYDFSGLIDNVAIWNRALSPDEIAQSWNNGAGVQLPTVSVSIDNTDVNVANGTGTVTFTFSEAPVSFVLGDTRAVGGMLSNLQQTDATHYTATFTGAANTDISDAAVSVTTDSWQEGNGNAGAGGSTAAFTVDTDADGGGVARQHRRERCRWYWHGDIRVQRGADLVRPGRHQRRGRGAEQPAPDRRHGLHRHLHGRRQHRHRQCLGGRDRWLLAGRERQCRDGRQHRCLRRRYGDADGGGVDQQH